MTQRLHTDYRAADDSPGLLLWQVTNRWQAAQRAALKPLGLTHVQFVLLASLVWLGRDGAVRQKDLAEHAATDVMMTSQVLRELQKKGLVRRDVHPDDGRAKAVRATQSGTRLANRAIVVVESCDRSFFGALGQGQAGFTRDLRRLRDVRNSSRAD